MVPKRREFESGIEKAQLIPSKLSNEWKMSSDQCLGGCLSN